MGIVVIGDVFIDVKGYSTAPFIPYHTEQKGNEEFHIYFCRVRKGE